MPSKQTPKNKLAVKSPTAISLTINEVVTDANETFKRAMQTVAANLLTNKVDLPKSVAAHDLLANFEEVCADMAKQAKNWVQTFVLGDEKLRIPAQGVYVEGTKGTYEVVIGDRKQRVESRFIDSHDEKKVTALLHAKALPLELCLDQRITYEVNEEKIHAAVASGKITQEEANATLKKVSYTVKRSTKLED